MLTILSSCACGQVPQVGFRGKGSGMVANRAYKFRIYPNGEQKILFAKTFCCVRMVYNHWLDRKIRQYEENKTNVAYTICAKEMAAMKKTEDQTAENRFSKVQIKKAE